MSFVCDHENDMCNTVMVATPSVHAIQFGNDNLKVYLYRERVDPFVAIQQHDNMIAALVSNNARVLNMCNICPDTSYLATSGELANQVFTRDPVLCTARGVVLGRFREDVRQKEIDIIATALERSGVPILGRIHPPGYVEGGDFIPAGHCAFIAHGNRTNMDGIQQMLRNNYFGCPFVATLKYPEDGLMKAIHLDCYFGLVGKTHAVVWKHALENVRVTEYINCSDGNGYMVNDAMVDVPLGEYLRLCNLTVIEVDDDVQERYGCNLLDLGKGRVLTQDPYVTEKLKEAGFMPTMIDFGEIHKMYGGIRCATQVLHRFRDETKNYSS